MNSAKPSTRKKGHAPKKGSNRKIAPSLVALSSAAVLTIYTVGYSRTRSASERFAEEGAQRRTAGPAEARPVSSLAPPRPAVDAPRQPTPSATPVVPPVPKQEAKAPPSRLPSSPPSPASKPAATPAPVPESTVASTAPPPVAPPAVSSPVTVDGDVPTTEPPATLSAPPLPHYNDGIYSGWGRCRHGSIEATVVVEGGKIATAEITECRTRYSCNWVSMLPPQVVSRQSAEVDYVSGATESADAFYYAVVEALTKAK